MGMTWAILTVLGLGPNVEDPAALVERLGAARYQERQKAAQDLLELGKSALPALIAAKDRRDAEVQNMVHGLIDAIEKRLLVEPTMVAIEARDRPLIEVVRDLAARSEMSVQLFPENFPAFAERKVTLDTGGPVPFWTAMSKLCQSASLQYQALNDSGMGGHVGSGLRLLQGQSELGPTSDQGPFRCVLASIHHHRDRALTGRPMSFGPFPKGVGPRPIVAGQSMNEQFYVQMQISTEPRLLLAMVGPPKLVEAVDDLGQSLLFDTPNGATDTRYAGYSGMVWSTNSSMTQVQINMRYPAQTGKLIKRLRGKADVTVTALRPGPITLQIAESAGRPVRCSDLSVQVHEPKQDRDGTPSLEFSLKPLDPANENAPGQPPMPTPFIGPESYRHRLEIVDAQGRPMTWYAQSAQSGPDGTRMTVRFNLNPNDPRANLKPAEVRLYDIHRAQTEVAFDFQDIPMPLP